MGGRHGHGGQQRHRRDLANGNASAYQRTGRHFDYAFTNDWRLDMDADNESLNADLDAAIRSSSTTRT